MSFVDSNNWFLSADGQLHVTHDGGRSWSAVPTAEDRLYVIDFVTTEIGWAVGRNTTCPDKEDCVTEPRLFRTQDGGRTWTEVLLPEGPELPAAKPTDTPVSGLVLTPGPPVFTPGPSPTPMPTEPVRPRARSSVGATVRSA